jgi:hypothetical protein
MKSIVALDGGYLGYDPFHWRHLSLYIHRSSISGRKEIRVISVSLHSVLKDPVSQIQIPTLLGSAER